MDDTELGEYLHLTIWINGDAMSDDKNDPLRAALEQIKIVCEDNEACDLLGRSLALKFVLGIAERALLQPASET